MIFRIFWKSKNITNMSHLTVIHVNLNINGRLHMVKVYLTYKQKRYSEQMDKSLSMVLESHFLMLRCRFLSQIFIIFPHK